jgi:hypothetical protein
MLEFITNEEYQAGVENNDDPHIKFYSMLEIDDV